jgi:Uma2 family endonuclease
MAVSPQPRLFTVEEYYRMAEAGILSEEDRVELINGEIIRMTAIGSRHAACVNRLLELFSRHFSRQAIVQVQNPVRLSDLSELEPDVALLHLKTDYYAAAHPLPRDVMLIVEVADASLGYDRSVKVALYAAAGIQGVWIVDLLGRQIESYQDPTPEGYGTMQQWDAGQRLAPLAFPDVSLAVTDIVGP